MSPAVSERRIYPDLAERATDAPRGAGVIAEKVRVALTPADAVSVPRYVEVVAVAALTLVALLLRTWDLPGSPAGIHGDETEMAVEALRSIESGGLGIWTGVTLGQPAGYAHWMSLIFRLGGADVTTMRLASAIPGIAMAPVGYLLGAKHIPLSRRSFGHGAACLFPLVRDSESHRLRRHSRGLRGHVGNVASD